MKQLLLLTLILPFAAAAQTFEIAAQAGYLNTRSMFFKDRNMGGLSGNFTFRCYLTKHLAVSAFYEYGTWSDLAADKKTSVTAVSHSFGIAPDLNFKHVFFGPNLELVNFIAKNGSTFRSGPAIGYGLHIGTRHKIIKHLCIMEQVGYDRVPVSSISHTAYSPGFSSIGPKFMTRFYARVGISFPFL